MLASLSDEQLNVVENAEGHFLVRACPGSGKTYTIAAKAAGDMHKWKRKRQGLAVISFTNVAQEKIINDIEHISGIKIEYPHFVGTIDSFINHYIFFPYIHLLGFNPDEVEMTGEPFQSSDGWFLKRKCALALRYDSTGGFVLPAGSAYELSAIKAKGIAQKLSDIENSRFTQSDAVFYSLQILELYPEVVDIVSARFPWIYVDEAQDTTPIHWQILELLSASGENERFGVIGDPDQSIYAWNGAEPEIFTDYQKKLEATNGQVFWLMESWRSSQIICNFYTPFSSLPDIPKAVEKGVADINIEPSIVGYDSPKDVFDIVDGYVDTIVKGETYAIVCESHSFIAEILGAELDASALVAKNPVAGDNASVLNLMHAKYDFDRGHYRSALLRAENVAFNLLWNFQQDEVVKAKGVTVREWYILIEEELEKLPSCELTVEAWCKNAVTALKGSTLFPNLPFAAKRKAQGIEYKLCTVEQFFTDADALEAERVIRTVHSVKGETYDNVLVILKVGQANRLLKGLKSQAINDTEDRRKLYVAITRARKSLTVLIPQDQLPV